MGMATILAPLRQQIAKQKHEITTVKKVLSNSHTALYRDLGATNGNGSLRLADHNSQLDRLFSSLKHDVPFELEAQLLVIRLINLRTTFEVRWNVSRISLSSY